MIHFIEHPYEVAVVGKNAQAIRKKIDECFLPDVLLYGSDGNNELPLLKDKYVDNKTLIYVCKDKVCQQPVEKVKDVLKQLK